MPITLNPASVEDLSQATGKGEKWGAAVQEFMSSDLEVAELEYASEGKFHTVTGGLRAYIAANEDVDARVVTRGGDRIFIRRGRSAKNGQEDKE